MPYISRKEIWTSQPQSPVEIDQGNDLGKGIVVDYQVPSNWDSVGNKFPATTGNITKTVGAAGRALQGAYQNSDNYINLGRPSLPYNKVTIEALVWVNAFQTTVSPYISGIIGGYHSDAGGTNGYKGPLLRFNNDATVGNAAKPSFNLQVGATEYVVTGAALSVNTLYHILATYDGATATLYVNGVQVAQTTHSITFDYHASTFFAGMSDFVVSTAGFTNKRCLNGKMFLGRIYNTSKTAAEAKQLADNAWQIYTPQTSNIFVGGAISVDITESITSSDSSTIINSGTSSITESLTTTDESLAINNNHDFIVSIAESIIVTDSSSVDIAYTNFNLGRTLVPWDSIPQVVTPIDTSGRLFNPTKLSAVVHPVFSVKIDAFSGKAYSTASSVHTPEPSPLGLGINWVGGTYDYIQLDSDADTQLDTVSCSMLIATVRTATTGSGYAYGYVTDLVESNRVAVRIPSTGTNTVQWAFGSSTTGSGGGALTAALAAAVFAVGVVNIWGFYAGVRGREIWLNGKLVASDTTATFTRAGTTRAFRIGAAHDGSTSSYAYAQYHIDNLFVLSKEGWSQAAFAELTEFPGRIFAPREQFIFSKSITNNYSVDITESGTATEQSSNINSTSFIITESATALEDSTYVYTPGNPSVNEILTPTDEYFINSYSFLLSNLNDNSLINSQLNSLISLAQIKNNQASTVNQLNIDTNILTNIVNNSFSVKTLTDLSSLVTSINNQSLFNNNAVINLNSNINLTNTAFINSSLLDSLLFIHSAQSFISANLSLASVLNSSIISNTSKSINLSITIEAVIELANSNSYIVPGLSVLTYPQTILSNLGNINTELQILANLVSIDLNNIGQINSNILVLNNLSINKSSVSAYNFHISLLDILAHGRMTSVVTVVGMKLVVTSVHMKTVIVTSRIKPVMLTTRGNAVVVASGIKAVVVASGIKPVVTTARGKAVVNLY